MVVIIRWLAGFAAVLLLLGLPARAEERIALVVGNAEYRTIGTLDNSVNDARLIAATLEGLGFEVTLLVDASQADLKRGIAAFGRSLRQAGTKTTGLFYYAGHGVQSFGTNYLLPVDTALTDAADLPLVAVEAHSVLRQMFSARNRTNIIILDACRNNPFMNVASFTDNGLAEMQAPTGSFLAYSTAPGAVALDGEAGNSPFTRALAVEMQRPGLAIEQMFKQVRIAVLEQTGGAQTPWDTSSLTSDFMFRPAVAAPEPAGDTESELWESVRRARDPVQIALFLRAYPESRYAADAQALLIEVAAAAPAGTIAKAPPAGPSEAERALIEKAQADGSAAAYQAYLDAYPEGTFADLARIEIAALSKGESTDPVGEGVTPETPAPAPPEPSGALETVTFNDPLSHGEAMVKGRSLAELIEGSPEYAPIEGLPDELWKGQSCTNCHQWNQARLCEQAQVYLKNGVGAVTRKQHPYGGGFKQSLAAWASHGCP